MNQRMLYLDHLRTALTVLVVVFHASIAYGAAGDWILVDVKDGAMTLTSIVLTLFTAVCQAFFMGLFFFLSGYFTPASFDRKGAGRFLKERLIRLGIPLACYYFLIGPLTNWYANFRAQETIGAYYNHYVWSFQRTFFGPAWFLEASLYFAAIYAVMRLLLKEKGVRRPLKFPGIWQLAGLAAALGAVAFLVRLAYPTGEGPLELQLGYFPSYILLFAAGVLGYRNQWLMDIPESVVRRFGWIGIVAIPVLPIAFIATGALEGNFNFAGGFTMQAIIYALWEPFVCFGIILLLIRWFKERWNAPNGILQWAGGNAYGVYIIHPPVIVGWTMAFQGADLPAFLKWIIVSALSILACFVLASLIRRVPGVKKII